MGILLAIEYLLLFLLSTWMTATAIRILRTLSNSEEEMQNLHGQVFGAVKSGDLPRAILILEGEPGPLASILSNILTEATKFTPKLRVAYKVTLESLKRKSMVATNPFRLVTLIAPVLGVICFVINLLVKNPESINQSIWFLVLSVVISLISWILNSITSKYDLNCIILASDLSREVLTYLLSPESPLPAMRGRSFPPAE